MGRLTGKVAIITGAGQGLGLAIAELFAKEGAKVVGTGRHVEKVEKAFTAVKAAHPDYEMTAMQHDVASKEEWEKIAKDTADLYGSVDIVVNNAAIMAMKGILDASPEEFLNVYKTNCLAVLLSIQAVVPYMEKAGQGSIVNIDSIGGLTSGERSVRLAVEAEHQGAFGVVVNAPIPAEVITSIKRHVDIPVVATIVSPHQDVAQRLQAGADILNVSAAADTPALVARLRESYPDVPIIATGGPTDQSIRSTITAGANAVTYTPTETNALLNHLTLNIYHDNVLISSSPASNQDTLASNLELGTFNYGEETLLTVEIIAPSDLGNNYEYTEGEINWIFTAEAYKDGKIVSPNTGVTSSLDSSNVFPEILIASLLAITILSIIISLHKISLN